MERGRGPTTIIRGGRIHTLDDGERVVEALLIEDGRVRAVGREADVRARASGPTADIDVQGATVLPGLIDTHPHLLHFGSLREPLVDITDAKSHAEIVARIAARATRVPAGEWIMTTPVGEPHYFVRRSVHQLAEGELPTRRVLDRATDRHPVVIQAWAPVLPNTIAFNSPALEKLGLGSDTPERVSNVWIERDMDGALTGRFHGSVTNYYSNDAFANQLWLKIPFLQYQYLIPGAKTAIREYHRQGVTAIYENHMMDKPLIDAYREMRRNNELRMRVMASQEAEAYGMPWSRPRRPDDFMARLEDAARSIELHDDVFRFNGVTIMWDGTCHPGGMRMREPYRGPYGEPTTGFSVITPEKAETVMRFCAERRLRLNTMAMGVEANEENLALLEKLAQSHDIASLRWILVHAMFIEPKQVERYARLMRDFTTSMSFCWGKGDMFMERLDPALLVDLLPLRRFFQAGFDVAGGSDWGPKSAFEQIQLALTHEFAGSGRRNLGPDQTITRRQAVSMWTRDAARVLQWRGIGSLGEGGCADLIVVDRDPLTCPVEDVGSTRVLLTLFAGTRVHDAGLL